MAWVFKLRRNRLNLQKRLTAFTLTVVVLTSGSIGMFLIQLNFRNQLEQIREEFNSITETINGSRVDKVTVALALVSASQSDISLFLSEANSELIPLVSTSIDEAQLEAAEEIGNGKIPFESKDVISGKVRIEGELDLILTTSPSYLYEVRRSEFLSFVLYLLIASSCALVLLRKVINKDVEQESQDLKLREKLKFEESRRKMLLEFASDTSHELRTPLTVIVGYLELLAKRKPEEIEHSAIVNMRKEALRLEKNIANLLTMMELEVIEDESLMPINLSNFLEQELVSFQDIEPNRSFTINVEKEIWIKGSEELLLKLLRNIFNNISRHSKFDSPVSVTLNKQSGWAEMSIEDGGPLSTSQSLEIETYLPRFSSSRSVSKGGSGLGFSIMKKSVDKLSGDLTLFHSELGGFGLKVRIPLENENIQ